MLVVRVRLKIKCGDKYLEVSALVNSSYEADTPQLLVPIGIAKELGLWPPPPTTQEEIFETAGGPLRVWIIREAAIVQIVASDVKSKEVKVDIVISPLADEPLISDILAGELEITVEDFAKGLWRFRWEPKEKVRMSERKGLIIKY